MASPGPAAGSTGPVGGSAAASAWAGSVPGVNTMTAVPGASAGIRPARSSNSQAPDGPIHEHRRLGLIDRGPYGWTEYIEPQPCQSMDQVHRYFMRMGELMCVITLLGGTDFHSNNIVACGEYPVPVDLEGLFHPRHCRRPSPISPSAIAFQSLAESPLRTGLLPAFLWEWRGGAGTDISAIGSEPGQMVRQRI